MSSNAVIQVKDISKVYMLYDRPEDRLKQLIVPGLKRLGAPFLRPFFPSLVQDKALFREFWALRDVSVELKSHETLGIIGQNGSGKSTLLQVVCGTLNPTRGKVTSHGRIAALLELGAGFNPDFTGRENVYMNAAIYGLSNAEIEARMQSILDFAEIGEHIDQPVKTYSSGMFVRLAFSVIANIDADILIIDEALAVGDAYFQQKCMRYLRNFQNRGSIFFVSHDTGAMMNFCDRVVWLHHGAVRAQGDPRKVCEEYLAFLYQQQTGALTEEAQEARVASAENSKTNVDADANVETELSFNRDSRSFGNGAAEITSVVLRHADGRDLVAVSGGERVELSIEFRALKPVASLISGFIVKDRLGQYLFGDNTFATTEASPVSLEEGQRGVARFLFTMPLLAPGLYSIAPSVASGTLQDHVQLHWMHEGLFFNVSTSVQTGVLVGIPMEHIELKAIEGV